jgi:hypothetical protein
MPPKEPRLKGNGENKPMVPATRRDDVKDNLNTFAKNRQPPVKQFTPDKNLPRLGGKGRG